jgi:hypothetical protein
MLRQNLLWSKRDSPVRDKKSPELFIQVTTLLAYGCPRKAIEAAFGLSENTVRDWERKAGEHCEAVHEQLVASQQLDLQHVQADEIKVKGNGSSFWLAMAIMVSTRLWLGGVIGVKRDKTLIQRLTDLIHRMALYRPLLLAVDGLPGYVSAFLNSFRASIRTGKPGAPRKRLWNVIHIVQVVKSSPRKGRSITRQVAHGCSDTVTQLLQTSGGGQVINTAFIERLNATFRQRLAVLSRRGRETVKQIDTLNHLMMLMGCVYNFCTPHHSLRLTLELPPSAKRRYRHRHLRRTPAMAAGVTDHCWSVTQLLTFKVPTRYTPPKKRGRKPKIRCPHCSIS